MKFLFVGAVRIAVRVATASTMLSGCSMTVGWITRHVLVSVTSGTSREVMRGSANTRQYMILAGVSYPISATRGVLQVMRQHKLTRW